MVKTITLDNFSGARVSSGQLLAGDEITWSFTVPADATGDGRIEFTNNASPNVGITATHGGKPEFGMLDVDIQLHHLQPGEVKTVTTKVDGDTQAGISAALSIKRQHGKKHP